MNVTPCKQKSWDKVAGSLKTRFDKDRCNHQTLCDPWLNAAKNMVQGWRNIASQGRLNYIPQTQRKPITWNQAITNMLGSLHTRAREQQLKGSWEYWAGHLPSVKLRYIPKHLRENRPPGFREK